MIAFAAPSARARLDAALAVADRLAGRGGLTVIGATRGAADDFARALCAVRGATLGISRFSLLQLASRLAAGGLAGRGVTPSTALLAGALATRAAFDATRAGSLDYFEPVAGTPGFPRALAETLGELRAAAIDVTMVDGIPRVGPDLARLLEHYERAIADAAVVDRTGLLLVAAERVRGHALTRTVVLLDIPIREGAERRFLEAVLDGADEVVATVAPGDDLEELLVARGAAVDRGAEPATSDLASLRRYLFVADEHPPLRSLDGALEVFSAPGEGREAVEIVRRVLREAARGVRFDEMAVLVRSTRAYFGLLEHAFARAGVPAWFDRGTRRPHPAGRAFLAILACAAERVSAVRFAEYLSLAQVPSEEGHGPWEPPADEVSWRVEPRAVDELEEEETDSQRAETSPDRPVVAGTLRAPWRWEALIVDARIIGGGAARWRRRLAGHRRELERRQQEVGREEGAGGTESATGARLKATLEQLTHLETFALPIVDTLEQWSTEATWGEWLERFSHLVPRVLRRPAHVLRVLGELRPMSVIGPVSLEEVRRVLSARLLTVEAEPPSRRYGRVFVGTPQQVRGRAFRVVFVPGLAERMFPQKPREDPLLLDALREEVSRDLTTETDRTRQERQLLQLAVGAAVERLCVSYPRLELGEARARVPSFYALDLLRAATGEVPSHEALEDQARQAGGASLAWPAPADPVEAIDDVEHDLAVVRRLIDEPHAEKVRGHAHYLLSLSEPLRRSVIERWRRSRDDWSPFDGLTRVVPQVAGALARQRLRARPYSLSVLQRYAVCPYQFLLVSIFKLHPLEEPSPLERIDPLTRGSLIHDIQARTMRTLRADGLLPLTTATLGAARARMDAVIDTLCEAAREDLAPAVDRVWTDDVAAIRRDMHGWLTRMDDPEWVPRHFEYGFGPVPGERDPASIPEPVVLEGGYALRGAVDLIEVHERTGELRVTDYKTGRTPERLGSLVIGGGGVLQPVLYALAVERALGARAREGRLFYCTATGGFTVHSVALDDAARRAGLEVLEIIDRAVEKGALMAAPADGACQRCDFTPVCGPDAGRRAARKRQAMLADLQELRGRP
jgi:CRISPR/Cas system-associated exonuclease Cas4 (RecB family)